MNSESYTRRGIFDPLIKNKLKVANIIPEWKYFLQSETPVQCTIRPSVVFLGEENRGCEMTHGTYGGRCREEGARVRLYTGDLSSAFSPILSCVPLTSPLYNKFHRKIVIDRILR